MLFSTWLLQQHKNSFMHTMCKGNESLCKCACTWTITEETLSPNLTELQTKGRYLLHCRFSRHPWYISPWKKFLSAWNVSANNAKQCMCFELKYPFRIQGGQSDYDDDKFTILNGRLFHPVVMKSRESVSQYKYHFITTQWQSVSCASTHHWVDSEVYPSEWHHHSRLVTVCADMLLFRDCMTVSLSILKLT